MEHKTSKTVQVKLLVPYGIIVATALMAASFIAGWHMSQLNEDSIKAEAINMVTSLSKDQKQK